MKNELQTLRLFSPLFPHIYRRNDWGDLENEPEDLSAPEILEYEDAILERIEKEKLPDEGKYGLAVYLDIDLREKVHSIHPSVEEWNDELWGVTEVQTRGELTPAEYAELTEWLIGQFSDGWGEGFEQREIMVDDGELYLSFWDASDRFFIKPEDEMDGQSFDLGMGGLGKLLRPNYVTEHFVWLINKHCLKKIRFHDLRHTCASLLLANGVPMKQIQIWLGHSTFSTTADIYAHLDYSAQMETGGVASTMFDRPSTTKSSDFV